MRTHRSNLFFAALAVIGCFGGEHLLAKDGSIDPLTNSPPASVMVVFPCCSTTNFVLWHDGLTLLDAVMAKGGFLGSMGHYATITRGSKSGVYRLVPGLQRVSGVALQPGDFIRLQRDRPAWRDYRPLPKTAP